MNRPELDYLPAGAVLAEPDLTETNYERELLGAVLNGYRDIPALTRIVDPTDFEAEPHEQVWRAVLAVHAMGEVPTPLTVRAKMGDLVARLGPKGPLFLVELTCRVPSQAPFLAERVREQAVRRQLHAFGAACLQQLAIQTRDPDDLVAEIRGWADRIKSRRIVELSTAASAIEQVIDTAQHGEAAATPTPWADVDDLIGGWYPGQLVVVGARPGVGKSIMLENAATFTARSGRHVAFISLEMSAKELTQRTLAYTAKVELTRIRRGQDRLSETDWQFINNAVPQIASTPIVFYDRPAQTIDHIRAAAWETRQEATRRGAELGMVVVDYLQLITPRDRRVNRQQQVGEMSRGLKQLAKELEVPVLAGAQLNRAPAQRTSGVPMLSDLREAGDIEQDADVVILLHDETVDDGGRQLPTGELQVVVAKNRQGPLGSRSLQKFGHYARITGAA